jgi:hypothetical protein
MLRKLYDSFSGLHDVVVNTVLQRYRLEVDDLPHFEDEDACRLYRAPLCREYSDSGSCDESVEEGPAQGSGVVGEHNDEMSVDEDVGEVGQSHTTTSAASHDPTPELASLFIST